MPEVVGLEQGSEAWHEWRRARYMASETPALLGLSKYQTAERMLVGKVRNTREKQNEAMAHGHEQEPLARDWYGEHFEPMRPACWELGRYGASLDGVSLLGDRILEIKSPWKNVRESERWLYAGNGHLTEQDYAQVQHQLYVCDAEACDFLVWDWIAGEGRIVTVWPDPQYWHCIWRAWNKAEKELVECSITL